MQEGKVERAVSAGAVSIEVRAFSRPRPANTTLRFEDGCSLIYSLWPRKEQFRASYPDAWGTRMELVGDITFVPSDTTLQGNGPAGRRRYLACDLPKSLFRQDWRDLGERALLECLDMRSPAVRRGLRRLLQEISEPSLHSPLAIEATATLLAIDIERRLFDLRAKPEPKHGGLSPARMRRLEERLRSEELSMPCLTELAAYCELSARHLARAFRQETGEAIGEYVNTIRRERACQMLTATDLPISEIAQRVGFSSPASFAYAFRKSVGLKPSEMRRKFGLH